MCYIYRYTLVCLKIVKDGHYYNNHPYARVNLNRVKLNTSIQNSHFYKGYFSFYL